MFQFFLHHLVIFVPRFEGQPAFKKRLAQYFVDSKLSKLSHFNCRISSSISFPRIGSTTIHPGSSNPFLTGVDRQGDPGTKEFGGEPKRQRPRLCLDKKQFDKYRHVGINSRGWMWFFFQGCLLGFPSYPPNKWWYVHYICILYILI